MAGHFVTQDAGLAGPWAVSESGMETAALLVPDAESAE